MLTQQNVPWRLKKEPHKLGGSEFRKYDRHSTAVDFNVNAKAKAHNAP